ncbi:oxygen-independent coproporphyrinogen III oxidase [Variovorax dokdonensis]|uniref:Coproporphyrinogen-III oxidase n=1 Tax=Variovorax dokdonensis TaxID=344883 RepID=A0ABT7NAV7_9BURK|nr:oxygen-independent coproporphyrinogen III oxidase [Variovorax dokdonensis]MDM0045069.1 oxygen-independent coproporphyrinogen III oxidase [Variovorax dokdonensis]
MQVQTHSQAPSQGALSAPVRPPTAPVAPALVKRLGGGGPRYTSYPTADRFVEAFDDTDYIHALRQRRTIGAQGASALSVYVHIPFCESLCYYCACNKVVTRHHERADRYLDHLAKEIELQTAHLGRQQAVSQLHLGGGSPTFLDDAQLDRLMALLQEAFVFLPEAERSIEVDPRTVDGDRLRHLAWLGFNRLSLGVQDFDARVQQAIHRAQPVAMVEKLMTEARALGFASINMDLIHGLPCQTLMSFDRTLDEVCRLRPDRIALYAYAHLPERFKAQRRISTEELPTPQARAQMLAHAIDRLGAEGYVYIGMDHFALPDDALAVAKRQGLLHRNFQGYSTQPDCDVIGLGVSAIGHVGATYSQNAKVLDDYYDHLDQGRLPIERGLALTRDDLLRRAVIMAIMCQGKVDFEAIGQAHLVNFVDRFAPELAALGPLVAQGLVKLRDHELEVTEAGWFFVRAIAMVFDRYLQADHRRGRYSQLV